MVIFYSETDANTLPTDEPFTGEQPKSKINNTWQKEYLARCLLPGWNKAYCLFAVNLDNIFFLAWKALSLLREILVNFAVTLPETSKSSPT